MIAAHVKTKLFDANEISKRVLTRLNPVAKDFFESHANLSGAGLQAAFESVQPQVERFFDSLLDRATVALNEDVDDDRRFAQMAIEEALKSVPEDDRPHPKVGAVVVKNGKVLSKSHRGENPKSHAEYIALEDKLPDDLVAGATVYTTLEPCTTRNHPKIPCAQRLVDRKVARVVIGMLDPNPVIRGLGEGPLSEANIETQLFPQDLKAQVVEMNRDFIRAQKQRQQGTYATKSIDERVVTAARLLIDATWDMQKAAWSFYSLHTEYGVARAVREIADEEKHIFQKMDAVFKVFTQDYDLPIDVSVVTKGEIEKINLGLYNLKAASMAGQEDEMSMAALEIQTACERIRTAARPYAYRVASP